MPKQEPWFIKERAAAFASLLLTKRKDVLLRARSDDLPVDLLVEILKAGKQTLRLFGVQLVGCLDLPAAPDTEREVREHLPTDRPEIALPVCLFLIDVRNLQGLYRWLVEPAVEEGARLNGTGEPTWRPLDDAGVADLIGQVNEWYDA